MKTFLIDTVRVERALHEMYAVRFGMTMAQMAATPMALTSYAYRCLAAKPTQIAGKSMFLSIDII